MEFATGLNSFTAVFIDFSYSTNKSFFQYDMPSKKKERRMHGDLCSSFRYAFCRVHIRWFN